MAIRHIILLSSFIGILPFSSIRADDCAKAIGLFNQGTLATDTGVRERVFKEAIAEYRRAIELDPDLPTPYISLGEVYSKLKDPKSAEGYYKKYYELTHFKTRGQLRSALTPRAIYVKPAKGQKVEPAEDLYFGFNETVLTPESEKQLQELLAALGDEELKNCRFQLAGHTCDIGSDAYNQTLSQRRARAVQDWLVKNGYPANRLQVTGFGKTKPVADNSTEEGRKLNRRVEVRTLGVKE